jgi:hypothetical protein
MISPIVVSVGAVCFGLVVGYLTYRTLARSGPTASVSDLAAVVAVIGGGTVTTLFRPARSDAFGWYSIGLLIGLAVYAAATLILRGREGFTEIMGEESLRPPTRR